MEGYHTYPYVANGEDIPIAYWEAREYTKATHSESFDAASYAGKAGTTPIAYWNRSDEYSAFEADPGLWKTAAFKSSHYAFNISGTRSAYGVLSPTLEFNSTAWRGVCANCGQPIHVNLYASRNAVSDLPFVTAGSRLFITYPLTGHLEMGTTIAHNCKGLSPNKYIVKYDGNVPVAQASSLQGSTGASVFYYGTPEKTKVVEGVTQKQYRYNGSEVYSTGLVSDCGFERKGYSFVGWNTKPDGSGVSIPAGSDFSTVLYPAIKNSKYSSGDPYTIAYTDGDDSRYIVLYAQWGPVRSSMIVRPIQICNEGALYGGKERYEYSKYPYQSTISLSQPLTLPTGWRVSYSVTGGSLAGSTIVRDSKDSKRQGGDENM